MDSSSIALLTMLRPGDVAGSTLASQVASRLDAAIAMGILAEGARLPSEPELAAALGVSQVTLRSALAALRTKGVIATVRGRGGGSIVRAHPEPTESAVRRHLLATSTEELRDIGDLYVAVASAAAGLAADRADESDVRCLEGLASAAAQADGPSEFWRAWSRFQVMVGIAAQSSRLTTTILRIQVDLAGLRSNLVDRAALASAPAHAVIVDAIGRGDEQAAASEAARLCTGEIHALIDCHLRLLLEDDR